MFTFKTHKLQSIIIFLLPFKTKVDKLIPRIRYEILDKEIKVRGDKEWRRQMFGPQIRLETIAKGVTQLIRDERVELTYFKAWEVRNYAERVSHLKIDIKSIVKSNLNHNL